MLAKSKKTFSIALIVCLLFNLIIISSPGGVSANVGDAVNWDIRWNDTSKSMTISWPAVPGATSYTITHNGTCVGTFAPKATVSALEYEDLNPNTNKYNNYYKVTPDNGANPILISLEGKIFGPNCYFYDSTYCTGTQAATDINSRDMHLAEMSNLRYAYFFKPGSYHDGNNTNSRLDIGFYNTVYGLGRLPTDTVIGGVQCRVNGLPSNNATQTFWRSIENIKVTYSGSSSAANGFRWAVSQAAPARRVEVGPAVFDWSGGWASGGYISDSRLTAAAGTASGQQFFYRNNWFAQTPTGCQWDTFFQGCTGAARPDNFMGSNHVTNIPATDLIREKPFVYLDGGEYKVFVPGWRNDASGVSWDQGTNDMGPGVSLDLLDTFYIAYPGVDTATTINAALAAGKNLLLTPGIYYIDKPIHVVNPNTIVLSLGFATLVPDITNQWGAMLVEDVDGVIIAGSIMFDAHYSSVYLLRLGEEGAFGANHSANPTILFDCFFRVGGFVNQVCQVDVAMQINSNDVIVDHTWIWRADHGVVSTGWNINKSDYGLWVTGDGVTCYGLFNEHFQKYTTYWEGEYGRTFFLQNETPYDPITQSNYMSHGGTVRGYAQYKVANKVNHHLAYGLASYPCIFADTGINQGLVYCQNAFEVPIKEDVLIKGMALVNLCDPNYTRFMINDYFAAPATNAFFDIYLLQYPPLSGSAGIEPIDDPNDPDFIAPSYASRPGLGLPFDPVSADTWHRVTYSLSNATVSGPLSVKDGAPLDVTLAGRTLLGYIAPANITVTMGGNVLTAAEYSYIRSADNMTAVLSIANVTGAVEIKADAEYNACSITYSLNNLARQSGPDVAIIGAPLSVSLTGTAGYAPPKTVTVTMGGTRLRAGVDYEYILSTDGTVGYLSIPAVTGNVVIEATGSSKFDPMNGGTYAVRRGTASVVTPYVDKPGTLYFNTNDRTLSFLRFADEGIKTITLDANADAAVIRLLTNMAYNTTTAGNYTNTITVIDGKIVTVDFNSGVTTGSPAAYNFDITNAFTTDMDVIISYNSGRALAGGTSSSINFQNGSSGGYNHTMRDLIITRESGVVDAKRISVTDMVVERGGEVISGAARQYYMNGADANTAQGPSALGNDSRSMIATWNCYADRVVLVGTEAAITANFSANVSNSNRGVQTTNLSQASIVYQNPLRAYLDARSVQQRFIVDYSGAAGGNAYGSQYVARGDTLTAQVGTGANVSVFMGLEPFVAGVKTQTVPTYYNGANYTYTRVRALNTGEFAYNSATGILTIPDVTGYVTIVTSGGSPVTPVNKSALAAAIGAFEDLGENLYTPASWAIAYAAYQGGLSVYNDPIADQGAVDSATQAITVAVAALVFAPADYAALDAALLAASARIEKDYTPASWAPLAASVSFGAALGRDLLITDQAMVDAAAQAINDSIAALESIYVNLAPGQLTAITVRRGFSVQLNWVTNSASVSITSAVPIFAAVDAGGVVTGVAAGISVIKITDPVSGVSANVAVNVIT